jgi:hypothetical protein
VIVTVARRDPAAAAGILGAVILGIIAILTGEKDDRYDYSKQTPKWFRTLAPASRRGFFLAAPNINKTRGF